MPAQGNSASRPTGVMVRVANPHMLEGLLKLHIAAGKPEDEADTQAFVKKHKEEEDRKREEEKAKKREDDARKKEEEKKKEEEEKAKKKEEKQRKEEEERLKKEEKQRKEEEERLKKEAKAKEKKTGFLSNLKSTASEPTSLVKPQVYAPKKEEKWKASKIKLISRNLRKRPSKTS